MQNIAALSSILILILWERGMVFAGRAKQTARKEQFSMKERAARPKISARFRQREETRNLPSSAPRASGQVTILFPPPPIATNQNALLLNNSAVPSPSGQTAQEIMMVCIQQQQNRMVEEREMHRQMMEIQERRYEGEKRRSDELMALIVRSIGATANTANDSLRQVSANGRSNDNDDDDDDDDDDDTVEIADGSGRGL